MRTLAMMALATVLAATAAAQQPLPRVDYAEVTITTHAETGNGRSDITIGGRGALTATNVTLKQMISRAFAVRQERVAGGPDWVTTERFDLRGTAPAQGGPVDPDAMVRMLEDRFQLVVRQEVHRMPVYLLKRAGRQVGPGVKPPSPGCEQKQQPATNPFGCDGAVGYAGPGWLFVKRGSVATLARFMSGVVGREIIDQTGLKGSYDLDVRSSEPGPPFAGLVEPIPGRPDIFTAVREQLGMVLEPSTAELEVHWIQRAERPQLD